LFESSPVKKLLLAYRNLITDEDGRRTKHNIMKLYSTNLVTFGLGCDILRPRRAGNSNETSQYLKENIKCDKMKVVR
jgi:hypothetical protein